MTKYAAQIDNIYFLDRIGCSLRWATADMAREELPDNIRRLLRKLERAERMDPRKHGTDNPTEDSG
jgi:hypothetical protein